MRVLLCPDRKVQCLEGECPTPVELAEQVNDVLVRSNRLHVGIKLPGVLNAMMVLRLVRIGISEIYLVTRAEVRLQPFNPAIKIGVRKIEYGKASSFVPLFISGSAPILKPSLPPLLSSE